jgi:hypothetical protein
MTSEVVENTGESSFGEGQALATGSRKLVGGPGMGRMVKSVPLGSGLTLDFHQSSLPDTVGEFHLLKPNTRTP